MPSIQSPQWVTRAPLTSTSSPGCPGRGEAKGRLLRVSDAQPDGPPAESTTAPEWWEDPSLPWKHKPTPSDIACFTWLGVVAVYSIVINVLRPTLAGLAPARAGQHGFVDGTRPRRAPALPPVTRGGRWSGSSAPSG